MTVGRIVFFGLHFIFPHAVAHLDDTFLGSYHLINSFTN